MNKTKLISLSLIIALVLMGTAFAWWTQSTTISNKITTGKLNVELVNIGGPGIYFTRPNGNPDVLGLDINKDYKAAVLKYAFPDKQTLDIEIANMFPGSYVTYIYGVDNTGTVPIKIDDVQIVPNADMTSLPSDKLNTLPIAFCFRLQKSNGDIVKEHRVDGTYATIADSIEAALKDVVIVEGDRLLVGNINDKDEFGQVQNGFIITIPEEWGNDTQNCSLAFSLKFNYTQANKITE